MGARLVERIGRAAGFNIVGRDVRVWVHGAPGADETEVVTGKVVAVSDEGAVVELDEPWPAGGERPTRRFLAVPKENGWGLDALWFSFIAVDALDFDGDEREPLGHWFIRLGAR